MNIFDNFPLNAHLVFHLMYCLLVHYLGKANQAKYTLKQTENLKKRF